MIVGMAGIRGQLDRVLRPQGRIFYGWWIVAAAFVVQWLTGMLWMQSYGAYMVLLVQDFGWSKAMVAGAYALTRVESGILGPLQGWMVDRFGSRLILSIGTVIFGVGFLLFSQVDSLLTFYLAFVMIALGSSLGGFATLNVSIVNWFNRHRSKAIAASLTGVSVGGFSVPLVVLALDGLGWRTTAVISGLMVLAIGLPVVQVVRHRPEYLGEVPDGLAAPIAADAPAVAPSTDFTARQAMRTRAFWLVSSGHALAMLTVSSMLVHLVPHLTEGLGFSLRTAAFGVAMMTGFQLLGQLSGGLLGDRFDKRLISMTCMFAHGIGLLVLTYAESMASVAVFAAMHGIAWGIRGPLMVSLRADYFGATSFGTIMGFSSLIVMLGMSAGPILSGYLADVSGHYQMAFTLIAALAFVGAGCFYLATPPPAPLADGPDADTGG